jgi:hypothetical protein
MMNKCTSIFLVLLGLVLPMHTFAHGGRTDASGCHNNRKTGSYHCHSGTSPAVNSNQSNFASGNNLNSRAVSENTYTSSGAFPNCTAARAAGAAPVRRGEPGYGKHLDRDGDGIGCEPYKER